jgi:hypothetical protein
MLHPTRTDPVSNALDGRFERLRCLLHPCGERPLRELTVAEVAEEFALGSLSCQVHFQLRYAFFCCHGPILTASAIPDLGGYHMRTSAEIMLIFEN